ncbi:DinB family protein [Dokdonia sp.]|uniref:DinB family protein n=1 Tax=Dokdonia sp. TaxID=2024995 RepID=UPI0032662F78
MKFDLQKSIAILERTPDVLTTMLQGISKDWIHTHEGEDTWSPYDVVGHLIVGEKTDWVVRTKIILSTSENKIFVPFDRFAQLQEKQDIPIAELLTEFASLREKNLTELTTLQITEQDLTRTGIHPELGEVTLAQLLAAWTAHDLGHIAQISRVMAKQYTSEVGPWKAYLKIVN